MPTRPAILSMHSPLPNPQRRRYTYLPRSLASLVLFALCLTFTLALAARPPAIPDTLVPPADRSSSIESKLAELEAKGIVLLDTRPPPKPASDWNLASFSGELLRRGYAALLPREDDEESTTATPSKTSTQSSSHSSSATSSATSSASPDDESVATAAPTATSEPLPVPFDSNIGADFASEACPQFIASFLATPEFQACYPVSLL
ncbi:hypothetical protein V491_01777, partial [Pseudogymnoascus sp. VKM F-3775]